jgi:hypothetical protein
MPLVAFRGDSDGAALPSFRFSSRYIPLTTSTIWRAAAESIWSTIDETVCRCEGGGSGMELVVKNARLPESGDAIADIAISGGMIVAIEPNVTTGGP